jgi:hypothetical protein
MLLRVTEDSSSDVGAKTPNQSLHLTADSILIGVSLFVIPAAGELGRSAVKREGDEKWQGC